VLMPNFAATLAYFALKDNFGLIIQSGNRCFKPVS
jgi:hypothetical protein